MRRRNCSAGHDKCGVGGARGTLADTKGGGGGGGTITTVLLLIGMERRRSLSRLRIKGGKS